MNHFFAYIDRMRYIERWALMRNSVRENIQEHSHQVAVLAHALAVIRNELFGGQVDAGAVAAAALYRSTQRSTLFLRQLSHSVRSHTSSILLPSLRSRARDHTVRYYLRLFRIASSSS